jgi:DNA damage-binding protein 1
MKIPEKCIMATPQLIFCTVSGSIGVIATLEEETFKVFDALQMAMGNCVKGIGGLDHSE